MEGWDREFTSTLRQLNAGVSQLIRRLTNAEAIGQVECFERGVEFARAEGIIPAPEPTHAIASAAREAIRARETSEEKVILTALCGHGHFDMAAYDDFLHGRLRDFEYPRRRSTRRWSGSPRSPQSEEG